MSSKSRTATFVPVLVFATGLLSAQAGWSATVTVVAFTTAAPFTATLSPAADAATLVPGMVLQNPFAGTPSIIAINTATGVITLTSQILSPTTPLPAVVVFAPPNPGTAASVTVVAFTTAAPFTATLSPAADAAKLAIGMAVRNPFAGTPTITAIDPATGVITLTSQILSPTTPLPAVVVFAIPGTLPANLPVMSMPALAGLALLLAGLGSVFARRAHTG